MTETVLASPRGRARLRTQAARVVVLVLVAVLLLVAPLYLDPFWLRTGFVIAGAGVGAVGLTILVGTAGQLSFAHPFFIAVGAFTYVAAATGSDSSDELGFGASPWLAALIAIGVSGALGWLVSPIASRLRGIYLGIATLSFIFIGSYVLENWVSFSGGFNGRPVPPMNILGFSFSDQNPSLTVAGVEFGKEERLWYLGITALALAWLIGRRVVQSRPGRALAAVRDSQVLAATNGVDVPRAKRGVFSLTSMFAGAAGVLFALSTGSVTPDSFNLSMAVSYLTMVVIGGLGSISGACIGATLVAGLPYVLQQYGDRLPLIVSTGTSGGLSAAAASAYLFGFAVVLCMAIEPRGLTGVAQRVAERRRTPPKKAVS